MNIYTGVGQQKKYRTSDALCLFMGTHSLRTIADWETGALVIKVCHIIVIINKVLRVLDTHHGDSLVGVNMLITLVLNHRK